MSESDSAPTEQSNGSPKHVKDSTTTGSTETAEKSSPRDKKRSAPRSKSRSKSPEPESNKSSSKKSKSRSKSPQPKSNKSSSKKSASRRKSRSRSKSRKRSRSRSKSKSKSQTSEDKKSKRRGSKSRSRSKSKSKSQTSEDKKPKRRGSKSRDRDDKKSKRSRRSRSRSRSSSKHRSKRSRRSPSRSSHRSSRRQRSSSRGRRSSRNKSRRHRSPSRSRSRSRSRHRDRSFRSSRRSRRSPSRDNRNSRRHSSRDRHQSSRHASRRNRRSRSRSHSRRSHRSRRSRRSRSYSSSRSRSRSRSKSPNRVPNLNAKLLMAQAAANGIGGTTMGGQQAAAATAQALQQIASKQHPASINQLALQALQAHNPTAQLTLSSRKLYVGNLPAGIGLTEHVLKGFFAKTLAALGIATPDPVISVWLASQGNYCFVEHRSVTDATQAMGLLSGLQLGGRELRIGRPADYQPPPPGMENFVVGGPARPTPNSFTQPAPTPQSAAVIVVQQPVHQPVVQQVQQVQQQPESTSSVLRLANMVSVGELNDPEEYHDLKQDILEEVQKLGTVVSIEIPRPGHNASDSGVGFVFIQYFDSATAQVAQNSLHGRKFGDAAVQATRYDTQRFTAGDFGDKATIA